MSKRQRLIAIVAVGVAVAGVLVVAAITRPSHSGQEDQADSRHSASSTKSAKKPGDQQSQDQDPDSDQKGQSDQQDQKVDLARRKSGDPMALGKTDAPVVLIEWSDFRCPFCGVWARDTKPKLMKYVKQGTLRIEFRDMPIFGKQSNKAAVAGRAAAAQGRFWQFYDAVYDAAPKRGHPDLTSAKLDHFGKKAGIKDMDAFRSAIKNEKQLKKIKSDSQQAAQLGASSTPAFLINDTPILGAQPTDSFVKEIKKQAKKHEKKQGD